MDPTNVRSVCPQRPGDPRRAAAWLSVVSPGRRSVCWRVRAPPGGGAGAGPGAQGNLPGPGHGADVHRVEGGPVRGLAAGRFQHALGTHGTDLTRTAATRS